MISLFVGLLTLALVLTSLLLILLILVQLPKKEAGLGMAFGGATADALFGAGSGTVLSRWTKYGTGIFLVLSLVLSVMRNHQARASGSNITRELEKQSQAAAATTVAPAPTNAALQLPVLQTTNAASTRATNVPGAPATNAAKPAVAPATNPPPATNPAPAAPAPGQ